jgi:flagellar motor switch protein FliN/FliY
MSSNNNMLSQEEIDALLRGGSDPVAEDTSVEAAAGETTVEETKAEPEAEVIKSQEATVPPEEAVAPEENSDPVQTDSNEIQEEIPDSVEFAETADTLKAQEVIEESADSSEFLESFYDNLLSQQEKDALGEVGNITMGSGSTALSELLSQRVVITSPKVKLMSHEEFFSSFEVPNIVIQVDFNAGITGYNILVIRMKDAIVMADLMMGGVGDVHEGEIGEIELSAASEAMNQMIGSASTSLSSMFGMSVNISPPITNIWDVGKKYNLPIEDEVIVVVSFDMKIGELLDTEIMQIMSVGTAKTQVELMMKSLLGGDEEVPSKPEPAAEVVDIPAEAAKTAKAEEEDDWLATDFWSEDDNKKTAEAPREAPRPQSRPVASAETTDSGITPEEKKKLDLLLDVSLKVSVVLGRTRKPIKEVLGLTPGAIVELSSLVDEPVEILVNGTLVAKGEVVVVNENFGVRITYILSPQERLMQLR